MNLFACLVYTVIVDSIMARIYNVKYIFKGGYWVKTDRLVSIIMTLLDKERIGAQELADMFEVSPRTIYRDIDTINMAGIPIHSTSGVNGGFEIMQQYKVDNKVFSSSDLSTLLMGLSSLSNVMQNKELVNVIAKIRSFIPDDKANDIELKINQIYIDLDPWTSKKNVQLHLEMIKNALQENRLLSCEYIDQHGNKTTRSIEACQLVLKNSHWYLYGYCHKSNDFRLFKLSRLSNLQLQDDFFIPRDYPKPILNFENHFIDKQIKIKIRIHKSIMDRVLEYCAYKDFSPDGDEYYIIDSPFIENDYYYNILFSFGDKCECLEPLHVRLEMKRRIRNLAHLYEK